MLKLIEERVGPESTIISDSWRAYLGNTLNTDGISLSENSTLSMWPVYAVMNEINPNERFCIDNVIVVGKKLILLNILNFK